MWENRFGNCGLSLFEFTSMGYVSLLLFRPLKDRLRYRLFSCIAICLGMGKKKRKQSCCRWLWEVDLMESLLSSCLPTIHVSRKTYFCGMACWDSLNICANHAVFENTSPPQLFGIVSSSMFDWCSFKQLVIFGQKLIWISFL